MNVQQTSARKEAQDDALQDALDRAKISACDADTAAREAVTFQDILEQLAKASEQDQRVFKDSFLYADYVHGMAAKAILDACFERAVALHVETV